MAEPFLRYVGGKRQLLDKLRPELVSTLADVKIDVYCEPFVGGGAVFFDLITRGHLQCPVHLGDANEELITTYRCLRDNPECIIGRLTAMAQERGASGDPREYYNKVRRVFNARKRGVIDGAMMLDQSARFIYLNKTSFQGLWRVNRKGEYNTPPGKFAKEPTICAADDLRAVSRALMHVSLHAKSYIDTVKAALEESAGLRANGAPSRVTFYGDPPYAPVDATADFTSYTAGGFGARDQKDLRDLAISLVDGGHKVVLSNADVPLIRELYSRPPFTLHEVQARRSVNCKGEKRGKVGELIITG